jgi:medium-chain acyl-[acyl-carrier-protein] hydrolase
MQSTRAAAATPWLIRPLPRPDARMRIFCFPHAGVGASAYRPWAALFPKSVEVVAVQPPGRENRLREPAIDTVPGLIDACVEAMDGSLDRPYAMFGHSMGACLAYEVARRLRDDRRPLPDRLFVSGRRAPSQPPTDPPLHPLDDADFVDEIQRRYGGIPAEVLKHDELVALLLPTLRADIRALETHLHVPSEPLRVAIHAFGGAQDPCVSADALGAWRLETDAGFGLRIFPGGHFYHQTATAEVVAAIVATLAPAAGPALRDRVA